MAKEFIPNYVIEKIANKTEAITKILSDIVANPGCAGLDGECMVFAYGGWMTITPVKKSKKE